MGSAIITGGLVGGPTGAGLAAAGVNGSVPAAEGRLVVTSGAGRAGSADPAGSGARATGAGLASGTGTITVGTSGATADGTEITTASRLSGRGASGARSGRVNSQVAAEIVTAETATAPSAR
ncbi:hypothetical protein [uncultured Brevundimonas sp.]|uniref:hypothetical protein n=1 Tax=uncultured Brevundimonas sp. TaxID=213418 RepID=UPI0030EF0576|tara:strand:- start:57360 stop:57725 length:366 start_codon:yes stop_codon:yes gene_type:complete